MREREYREEALLSAYLEGEALPQEVADAVTPWRRAMRLVLVGLALQMVTLQFLYLNYILPVIGTVCLVLGMRALGGENRAFALCRAAAYSLAVLALPEYALMATVYYGTARASAWYMALVAARVVLMLVLLLALRAGIGQIGVRTGIPVRTGSATALIVWDIVVVVLALLRVGNVGLLGGILFLGSYAAILVSLRRVYMALDDAGYALSCRPPRISDRALAIGMLAVLVGTVCAAYALAHQLPMEFAPVSAEEDTAEPASVREELLALGFPADILRDLTPEELLACAGARRVVVKESVHPMNDGREVTSIREEDGCTVYHRRTVYDEKELTLTGIAVELPAEDRARWYIIQHFRWTAEPARRGTEALRLWSTVEEAWQVDGAMTGRVLTELDAQTYAAPYFALGRKTYRTNSIFWGESENTATVASFSFPDAGTQCRGYVAYTVKEMRHGSIFDFWIDYFAPRSPVMYPVQTAAEYAIGAGMYLSRDSYRLAQDAVQFYPWE